MEFDVRSLYEQLILDHYKHPRNYCKMLDQITHTAEGFNPLCGDQLRIDLEIKDDAIIGATFNGQGCAISTASASLMLEHIKCLTKYQAEQLFNIMHEMFLGREIEHGQIPTKLTVLEGVKNFPTRIKCATLPWHTLHAAFQQSTKKITTE